jgi:formylglycine-generating enzyme required for sulfatase activity
MKHKHAITAAKLKKPAASPTVPPPQGLRKVARFLMITGSLILFIVLLGFATVYWDDIMEFLLPTARSRAAALRAPDGDDGSPLKLNARTAPKPAPEGMVWIPGGDFYMGTEEMDFQGRPFADAMPVHRIYVDGFWMDTTEVTNEQFADFVKATSYITVAETEPDPKDFPDIPVDEVPKEPFSAVFKKPTDPKVNLNDFRAWWDVSTGACWKHPEGRGSDLKGREKHPVVHICWHDAVAYCQWAKKRLPTEAEWEFAARGGLDRKKYPWGDEMKPEGKWIANVWQGDFPLENTREDGFLATAPVGSYPPNGYGLHDMAGNVWEWCSDFYLAHYYDHSPPRNPTGPKLGFDIQDPREQKRVQRGGSFLCSPSYCERYIVGTRHPGEPKSAANHLGFRCVKDRR